MLLMPAIARLGNTRFLAEMAESRLADTVVDGYPEYATRIDQLEPQQREAFLRAAETIVRSYSTRSPIGAIAVLGHADRALRKPVHDRAAFELEISQLRATSARDALLREIRRLAFDAHFSKVLPAASEGRGNQRPAVRNAATEAQMRKNRRVELFLFQAPPTKVRCGVR